VQRFVGQFLVLPLVVGPRLTKQGVEVRRFKCHHCLRQLDRRITAFGVLRRSIEERLASVNRPTRIGGP
jgi:hypothetical protein